jgi:hypothetical protein
MGGSLGNSANEDDGSEGIRFLDLKKTKADSGALSTKAKNTFCTVLGKNNK